MKTAIIIIIYLATIGDVAAARRKRLTLACSARMKNVYDSTHKVADGLTEFRKFYKTSRPISRVRQGMLETAFIRINIDSSFNKEGVHLASTNIVNFRKAQELLFLWENDTLSWSDLLDQLRAYEPNVASIKYQTSPDYLSLKDSEGRFDLNDVIEMMPLEPKNELTQNYFINVARIRGPDSLQLSRSKNAEDLKRRVFWLEKEFADPFNAKKGIMSVEDIRVSLITRKGKSEVIEAMVPVVDGNNRIIWYPRLYEYKNQKWVSVQRTSSGDDLNHCTGCHGTGYNFGPTPKVNGYAPTKGWFKVEDEPYTEETSWSFEWKVGEKRGSLGGKMSLWESITRDPILSDENGVEN